MYYEILHQPSYAMAAIHMDRDEQIQAQPDAMVSMSDAIKLTTGIRGGLIQGFKRRVLAGESFFINTFLAEDEGEVTLAPAMPGDITPIEMTGNTILAQSTAYLASSHDIEIDSAWGGAKTFVTREGLWLLKCSGWGLLLVASYGAIHQVDLAPGQKYTVDSGHMVAFDQSIRYTIGKAGSWAASVFSGEGLVCKLEGPGRVYMQTRNDDSYIKWLSPKLPTSNQR